MGSGKSSEELLDLRAKMLLLGCCHRDRHESVSFSPYSPDHFFSFSLFLPSVGFMLLFCILSCLKQFINLHKGNFLHRELSLFYIFCMYFIVTNWTTKTPPYAVSPHFSHWLEELGQAPGMFELWGFLAEGLVPTFDDPRAPVQGWDFWGAEKRGLGLSRWSPQLPCTPFPVL